MNGRETKSAVNCEFTLMGTQRSRWEACSVAWKCLPLRHTDWVRTHLPDKCQRKWSVSSWSVSHLSTGDAKAGDCHEFKAILGYTVISKATLATYSMRPLSKIKCQEGSNFLTKESSIGLVTWLKTHFSVTLWHCSDLSAYSDGLIINMPSNPGLLLSFNTLAEVC